MKLTPERLDELIAKHLKYAGEEHTGSWQQAELMAFVELKSQRAFRKRLDEIFAGTVAAAIKTPALSEIARELNEQRNPQIPKRPVPDWKVGLAVKRKWPGNPTSSQEIGVVVKVHPWDQRYDTANIDVRILNGPNAGSVLLTGMERWVPA